MNRRTEELFLSSRTCQRRSQHGCVRITKSSLKRRGRNLPLKPGEQSLHLRMIREPVHRHRKRIRGKKLERIARLENGLAFGWAAPRRLPGRNQVVHKRIVHPLRDLVADKVDIRAARISDNARIHPGGRGKRLHIMPIPMYRLIYGRVESKYAAVGRVATLIKQRIPREHNRQLIQLERLESKNGVQL